MTLAKIHRYVLRNSLIRSASFVRSLDFACVTDTLQHSTCRKFPTSLTKFHWGMHFERGRYRHFLTVICGRNFAFDVRRSG